MSGPDVELRRELEIRRKRNRRSRIAFTLHLVIGFAAAVTTAAAIDQDALTAVIAATIAVLAGVGLVSRWGFTFPVAVAAMCVAALMFLPLPDPVATVLVLAVSAGVGANLGKMLERADAEILSRRARETDAITSPIDLLADGRQYRSYIYVFEKQKRQQRIAAAAHVLLGFLAAEATATAVQHSIVAAMFCGAFTVLCALGLIFRWGPAFPVLTLCTGGCLLTPAVYSVFGALALLAVAVVIGLLLGAARNTNDGPQRWNVGYEPSGHATPPPSEPPRPENAERLDSH